VKGRVTKKNANMHVVILGDVEVLEVLDTFTNVLKLSENMRKRRCGINMALVPEVMRNQEFDKV
jgi:hypothetical protein